MMQHIRSKLRCLLLALTLLPCITHSVKAVATITSSSTNYNTANNIGGTVSNWSSGWGNGNTNTGWNYLGNLTAPNGLVCSGVYLGNGWVLTAGHVGAGNFTLDGNIYDYTGLSYTDFTNSNTGTNLADLTLFRISTTSITGLTLAMPSLTLASTAPTPFSFFNAGSNVVMIGNGGGKSWGVNTVTTNNIEVTPGGTSYLSVDFATAHGTTTSFSKSITNNAELIAGDSGGGDFIKLGSSWQLAGINEAVDANGGSYFIQLSAYNSQIQTIMTSSVPEPGMWVLFGIGGCLLIILKESRRRARKIPE